MLYTDWSEAAGFRGALSINFILLHLLSGGTNHKARQFLFFGPFLYQIQLKTNFKYKDVQFSSGSHESLGIYLARSSTSEANNINEFRTVSKFYYCSVEYSMCSIVSMLSVQVVLHFWNVCQNTISYDQLL